MNYTVTDKLAAVEALIEQYRWSKHQLTAPEKHAYAVLRAVATDYRGRLPDAPGVALTELERRIKRFRSAKTADGYAVGPTQMLASEIVARWPIIRQALEQFETAAQEAAE